MHLPNGSYVTFGGNGAVSPGGNIGSVLNPGGASASFDATYKDYDGSKSIRILNPCTNSQNMNDSSCQWYDNPAVLSMQKKRWYSAAESLPDGSVVLIGGFVNGGYVNRNMPNIDPAYESSTPGTPGAAEPTFEFYPSRGGTPEVMQFMITTSGLNAYAHTFLMPSGKMFVQANLSTSASLSCLSKLYLTNIDCSHLGLQCQRRDSSSTYAEQCCSCIPRIGCSRNATVDSRKQLDSNDTVLWWFRHASR